MDLTQLKIKHPNFTGDWNDLIEFEHLINSPIRSKERTSALKRWSEYKLNRQLTAMMDEEDSHDGIPLAMTKGGHIKAASKIVVNLSGATLDNIILGYADLRAVVFKGASMKGVWMKGVQMQDADLSSVDMSPFSNTRYTLLINANFNYACLDNAIITNADLSGASFINSTAIDTNFSGSNLTNTRLVGTNLSNSDLSQARVYGIAAWDINKTNTIQKNLLISASGDTITVDDLEIAQFIYLLLESSKITSAISTLGRKAVLILGRFTPERKAILDAMKNEIRDHYDLLPIVFDFERAVEKDFTETIKVLAGLSRFVIADISQPKSSPLELQATIPNYMVPFVIIHHSKEQPFSMFVDLWKKYHKWVLEPVHYSSKEELIQYFDQAIITPALQREQELIEYKLKDKVISKSVKDFAKE